MTINDKSRRAGSEQAHRQASVRTTGGPGAPVVQMGPGAPESAQGKGRGRTVAIALAVVVLALAAWLAIWLLACNGASLFDPSAKTGQAPYKTDAEMQAELDRVVEEGMFNISIASVIQFDAGDAPGTAYIENVPGNRYDMRVSITEDATGETVYESGVLKPNQSIEDITLTHALDAGMHDATATFVALDPVTHEETGKAAAKVTLNVLE